MWEKLLVYLGDLDIIGILGLGAIGLGFVLAVLSAFLLSIGRVDRPSVIAFMGFSLAMVGLGIGSQYMALSFEEVNNELREEVSALKLENLSLREDVTQVSEDLITRIEELASSKAAILGQIVSIRALTENARSNAQSASDNTGDVIGCVTASGFAVANAINANTELDILRGRVEGLNSSE